MNAQGLKERLIEELEKLSEDRLREILDFVGYLRAKESRESSARVSEELDPHQDPILELIGTVDVEPFSHNIDKELYGHER